MNPLIYLFPIHDPEEDWKYMFAAIEEKRFFIAERGSMLKDFKKNHVVKMRLEHIASLKKGVVNELIFDSQLRLI